MPKLKVQNRFGIIPNDLLNNPLITLKSKGLFGYLQSKPDDWDFSADRIKNDTKENRDAILSGLKELEQFGYLQRNRYKTDKGQWSVDYILYDNPYFDTISSAENPQWIESETSAENPTQENPTQENPTQENPTQENPTQENPTLNKERNTKKEIVKSIYISNDFLNDLILEFIENRKQLKKPMTALAITKLVNKCETWQKVHKNEIIKTFFDRAIECGWAGVFEQKEKAPTTTGQKTGWIDYAGEKEKTLKREADANRAKQDEQDAIENQKRYDAMAIQWFSRLPEGDLKNKINVEIDENLTIKKAFEIAELQPLGSLMRDQKFEFAKNQRERMRILHIRKYYETARELAR